MKIVSSVTSTPTAQFFLRHPVFPKNWESLMTKSLDYLTPPPQKKRDTFWEYELHYIVHCTVLIVYLTIVVVYSLHYIVHCTVLIVYLTIVLVYSLHYIVHCTVLIVYLTIVVVYSLHYIVHCTVLIVYLKQWIVIGPFSPPCHKISPKLPVILVYRAQI